MYRQQPPPPEVDRSLLIVGLAGRVIALERASGHLRWRNDLLGGGGGDVKVAIRYGALIVSALGAVVYRLDYQSGRTLWQSQTRATGPTTLLIESDGITVAKAGYVECFAHDGKRLWQQPLSGLGTGTTSLGYPGNVA